MFWEISQNSLENTCARNTCACNFTKKETLAQVFSCEFCEISKNTFFTEHLWATASVYQTFLFFMKSIYGRGQRGVFKTLQNIYDEAFLWKQLKAKNSSLFSPKAQPSPRAIFCLPLIAKKCAGDEAAKSLILCLIGFWIRLCISSFLKTFADYSYQRAEYNNEI